MGEDVDGDQAAAQKQSVVGSGPEADDEGHEHQSVVELRQRVAGSTRGEGTREEERRRGRRQDEAAEEIGVGDEGGGRRRVSWVASQLDPGH